MRRTTDNWIKAMLSGLVLLAAAVLPCRAVILELHTFTADEENWGTRDGELSVAQNAFDGGVLAGDFGAANPGDVVTDAYRLTSINAHSGYILTTFSFDFYSVDTQPSDLLFRFGDGSTTFFRSLTLASVGSWSTYSFAVDNQSGWLGGAPSSFTNVLRSATFYDIQLTQNGTAAQTYYVDNFQIEGEEPGYAGAPGAVPEPATISLMLLAAAGVAAMRRKRCVGAPGVWAAALLIALAGTSPVSRAESFDADAAGWDGMDSGSMNVAHAAPGHLTGAFGGQDIAFPQSGSFAGPADFVDAAFGGGFEPGGSFLGFDFRAVSARPAALRVTVGDAEGRRVSRFLKAMIDDTGVWYSFRISLAGPAEGRWDGDIANFDAIMSEVATFSIDLSRKGEAAQTYEIDNVFVDGLPDASATPGAGPEPVLTWQNLRPGEPYRVEASPAIDSALWTVIDSFTATGALHVTEYAGTNKFQFFRIVMP